MLFTKPRRGAFLFCALCSRVFICPLSLSLPPKHTSACDQSCPTADQVSSQDPGNRMSHKYALILRQKVLYGQNLISSRHESDSNLRQRLHKHGKLQTVMAVSRHAAQTPACQRCGENNKTSAQSNTRKSFQVPRQGAGSPGKGESKQQSQRQLQQTKTKKTMG